MKKHSITAWCCVLGVALLGVALPVIAAAPLAEKVPAQSLLYVGWAGRSLGLTFDGSMFGQSLQEPAVRQLMGGIKRSIFRTVGEGKNRRLAENLWEMAAIVWQQPIAVTVTDMQVLDEGGDIEMKAALLIDLGDKKPAFEKHMDAVLAAIGDEVKLKDETLGEITFRTLPGPQDKPVSFGFIGKMFFLTIGPGVPRQLIELKPADALSGDVRFVKYFQELTGANEQISFYVDVSAIMKVARDAVPRTVRAPGGTETKPLPWRIVDALGFGKTGAIAGTVRIVDRGMHTKVRLFSPAPHRGLLMPLAGAPLSDADLAGVPADAIFLLAGKLSPSDALGEIRRAVEQISPQARAAFDKELASLGQTVGVSIEKDIIASLGDTWVLSSAPSYGGLITGTLLTIQVKDTAKLSAALEKIENFARKQLADTTTAPTDFSGFSRPGSRIVIRSLKAGRVNIRYLAGNIIRTPLPIAPAWAIHKGRMYLAPWPQVIQSAIEYAGKDPLTKSPQYLRIRSKISPKASGLMYVNVPKLLRDLYPLQIVANTMLLNTVRQFSPLAEGVIWPLALSRLEKYAWPEATVCYADADGVTLETYGAGPATTIGAPVVAGMATAILYPSISRAKTLARRTVSMSNVRMIGMAMVMYSNENDGGYPQRLGFLKEYVGTEKLFVSPVSGRKPPEITDGRIIGEIDYIYIPPGRRLSAIENPAGTIVIYERPENYDFKGTVAGFADGHVEWVSMERFDELVNAVKKRTGKPDDDK